MGKRIIVGILVTSILLTFTACGQKTEVINTETEVSESLKETEGFSETNTVEELESESETFAIIETSETYTEEVTVSVSESVETEVDKTNETESETGSSERKDYLSIVEAEDDNSSFALRYIDGDDMPELVVVDAIGDMSIYTMKGDSVVCLVDSMYSVEWTYYEKKSVLCCFARWNGGGDEGGYGRFYYHLTEENGTFTYESPATFKNVYNAIYDENGKYTGEGMEGFYYQEEEIEEAAYQQIFSDLGIVEYEDELLIASMSKDEIIEELREWVEK